MQFKNITATVVYRHKRDNGTQAIRLTQIFSKEEEPKTGKIYTVQYKDCWLPFRWQTKKGMQDLKFSESTPEEVQYFNTYTKKTEYFFQRFTFYCPQWMWDNEDVSKNRLKKWRTSTVQQLDLFHNDDNPITIIEEQDAEYTRYSDERARDLRGTQYEMFDAPINFSFEDDQYE